MFSANMLTKDCFLKFVISMRIGHGIGLRVRLLIYGEIWAAKL